MKYTIESMPLLTYFDENQKKSFKKGYAFMDEVGSCFIIVYGENRRDSMIQYLADDTDPIGLKYQIIKFK